MCKVWWIESLYLSSIWCRLSDFDLTLPCWVKVLVPAHEPNAQFWNSKTKNAHAAGLLCCWQLLYVLWFPVGSHRSRSIIGVIVMVIYVHSWRKHTTNNNALVNFCTHFCKQLSKGWVVWEWLYRGLELTLLQPMWALILTKAGPLQHLLSRLLDATTGLLCQLFPCRSQPQWKSIYIPKIETLDKELNKSYLISTF